MNTALLYRGSVLLLLIAIFVFTLLNYLDDKGSAKTKSLMNDLTKAHDTTQKKMEDVRDANVNASNKIISMLQEVFGDLFKH